MHGGEGCLGAPLWITNSTWGAQLLRVCLGQAQSVVQHKAVQAELGLICLGPITPHPHHCNPQPPAWPPTTHTCTDTYIHTLPPIHPPLQLSTSIPAAEALARCSPPAVPVLAATLLCGTAAAVLGLETLKRSLALANRSRDLLVGGVGCREVDCARHAVGEVARLD